MSTISGVEMETAESQSRENSSHQDSTQDRKGRKPKRPEIQIYRPRPARGGGDGASPGQPDGTIEKSKSNERKTPEKPTPEPLKPSTEQPGEKSTPDRPSETCGAGKDQRQTGVKKSFSDVGQDRFFDSPRAYGNGRRDSGGYGREQEGTLTFRRGGGGGGFGNRGWQHGSGRFRGGKSNQYYGQNSDYRDNTSYSRQQQRPNGRDSDYYNRQQGRPKQENRAESHEDVTTTSRSTANGGSERGTGRPGRMKKESSNSSNRTVRQTKQEVDWRNTVDGMMGLRRTSASSSNEPRDTRPSLPPPSAHRSMDDFDAPCATSSPQCSLPDPSNHIEPIRTAELRSIVAAADPTHETNMSWGDIMEEEDRRSAAGQAPMNASKAQESNHNRGESRKTDPTDRAAPSHRGGMIPITPEMASAFSRGENRSQRGRGWNRHTDTRSRYQHQPGRGGGRGMSGFAFPEGRQISNNGPNQPIRFSAPGIREPYALNAPYGRGGGMISATPPVPPAYADREEGENTLLPPHIAQQISKLENEIGQLARALNAGRYRKPEIDQLMECSKRLQSIFMDAVFNDPTKGEEQRTLEHRMWKSAFYQPVEALRSALQANAQTPDAYCHKVLLRFIDEGIQFYENLLAEHERNFGFKVDEHLYATDDKLTNILPPGPSSVPKLVKYSLACCQRYFVSLGDLARYREQVTNTQKYGVARNYYNKAAQLAPTNGRAHNQLALLAVYTNRWLDAVFYYVRSLAAKHAFLTARESFGALFDDIRKKVDYYETGRKRELEQLKKERADKDRNRSPKRLNQREIWKFPDGRTSDLKIVDKEIDEMEILTKVTAQELHKRCVAYLLRCAGILYTKIGMECFEDIAEIALSQFRALLALEESPLSSAQLVQLTVIFLFLIHHTSDGAVEHGVMKAVQNYAILLSFSYFGLLLERLEQMLRHDQALTLFCQRLHLLLPSIRIFSIWMTVQDTYKLYSNLPSNIGGLETERFSVSLWTNLAKVCTLVERFRNDGTLKVIDSPDNAGRVPANGTEAVLPEDLYTTSFFDIFQSKPQSCILWKELPPELAAEHLRLDWLLKLATILDGYGCEWFSIEDGKYVASSSRPESPRAGRIRTAASDDEDAPETRDTRSSASDQETSGEMSHLQRLQRDQEMKKSALEREGQYRAEIIVEPYQLVIDTNTFIDHRTTVEKIVMAKLFKLAVPLVVYNELIGLAKGEEWVSQQAKASLNMLHEFTKGSLTAYSRFVEAVTSTGKTLPDFDYHRNEEAERIRNDDLILKCCRSLGAGNRDDGGVKPEIRNLRYEPITIYRKVVLLTDDKNLRLKAKGDDLPVVGIRAFAKMARLD